VRAVIQRVAESSVCVDRKVIAEIGRGLLVFLGVEKGDVESDAEYLVEKIVNLRIFEDEERRMNRSLLDVGGRMLAVSQFTLLGDVRKGRRPSFAAAEEPARARELYDLFMELARREGIFVIGGVFQAMMDVHLVNDGPVTFVIDSKKRV
jgi:D-tyrosyl-tRNA(Tyr) deacylase